MNLSFDPTDRRLTAITRSARVTLAGRSDRRPDRARSSVRSRNRDSSGEQDRGPGCDVRHPLPSTQAADCAEQSPSARASSDPTRSVE